MNTFTRLVAIVFFLTAFSGFSWAQFVYIPDLENSITYDYCPRDLYIKVLVLQTQGENDFLKDLNAVNKTNGVNQTYLRVKRQGQPGIDSTWSSHIVDNGNNTWEFRYKLPAANITMEFIDDELQNVGNFHKWYLVFRITHLPSSISPGQTFITDFDGLWEAQGGGGDNDFDGIRKTVMLTRPNTPIGLIASENECGEINLTWSNNQITSCNNDGVQVRRNGDIITPVLVSGESYKDDAANLVAGQNYEYSVRYLNSSSENFSAWSAPDFGNTYPLPQPIGNFEVASVSCAGIARLEWSNGSLYNKIEVRLNNGTWVELNGTATFYNMDIGTGNTANTIRIRGRDKCGEYTPIAVLNNVRTPQPPGPLSIDSIREESPGVLKIYWSSSQFADEYDVIRKGPGNQSTIGTVSGNTYEDDGAETCTQYSYRVRAVNDCGDSESAFVAAPLLAPDDVQLDQSGLLCSKGYFPDRVELDWVKPDNLAFDHYKIFRKKLGSSLDSVQIGVADKNAVHYVDEFAEAGTIYRYFISSTSECDTTTTNSSAIGDIGFRLPVGSVSGNVHFENGQAVENVQITVDRVEGTIGRAMRFNGNGSLDLNTGYGEGEDLAMADSMTFEFWMNQVNPGTAVLFKRHYNGEHYQLNYTSGLGFTALHNDGGPTGISFLTTAPDTLPYVHIALVKLNGEFQLYLNGDSIPASNSGYAAGVDFIQFRIGDGFDGLIDEFRVYSGRAKSQAEIEYDMPRILNGNETGMVGYWGINEGVGNGVYDISRTEDDEFNGNHLLMVGDAVWESNNIPTSGQLGHRAFTDAAGNYIVTNVRYTGNGNTFNVVPFFSPQGTPHDFEPVSTVLFLGEGAVVQSGVDFVDKSSFNVRLRSFYALDGDTCENKTLSVYVDGSLAIQSDGNLLEYDDVRQLYEFQVPIGRHQIQVRQDGHLFESNGYWPGPDTTFNFQADVDGIIELEDLTRIRVAGRVVGGTVEAGKEILHHLSKNNIGVAEVVFTSENGCHKDTVRTDSISGEYAIDLLPFRYDPGIVMESSGSQTLFVEEFFDALDVIDFTQVPDSSWALKPNVNPAGDTLSTDSSFYHYKRQFVYRAPPSLDVLDARTDGLLSGENELVLETGDGGNVVVPLSNLNFPVFFSARAYRTRITAFEEYFNYDPVTPIADRVPIQDGHLIINNGLGNAAGIAEDFQEEIAMTDGSVLYTFIGSIPEVVKETPMNGEPDSSFLKSFNVVLETEKGLADWEYVGYVFGGLPIPGSSFVTKSPETVDYILRDPPGSNSSAYFKEETSASKSKNWYASTGGSSSLYAKVQLGVEFSGGFSFLGSYSTTLTAVGGVENLTEISGSFDQGGNLIETTSFAETVATSDMSNLTGAANDLFMGKSYNFLFGAAFQLTMLDTSLCYLQDADCIDETLTIVNGRAFKLGKRISLLMAPDSFETTFIYDQNSIENKLIPDLVKLRNQLITDPEFSEYTTSIIPESSPVFGVNNDDLILDEVEYNAYDRVNSDPMTTEPEDYIGASYIYTPDDPNKPDDQVRWYNQQIRLWKEALALNEQQKLEASQDRNISFVGGPTYAYDHVSNVTEETSQSYELSLSNATTIFVDAYFGGNGFSAQSTLAVTGSGGEGSSESTSEINAFGYTLRDENTGDFMSVDVKDDGFGNGPVFSLRGGETMCPWEQGDVTKYFEPGTPLGESSIRREWPELDVTPTIAINVPEHQPAKWTLKLRNMSPTGDIQWYGLRVIDATHPPDVSFKINGLGPNRVFEIPPGETLERVLEMTKGAAKSYSGIQLVLYSTCEYDAFQNGGELVSADTITIGAEFIETCSPISISLPRDQWVKNLEDGNAYEVLSTGFDQSYQDFEKFQLQYKPTFSSDWRGMETFWKGQVPIGQNGQVLGANISQQTYSWDVSEIADGPYEIRAVTTCLEREYESPSVSGIIDRIRPHAFGNPQPADGVLDPNDDILLTFNETIDPTAISRDNFSIRGVLNGSILRHGTAIQMDGVNDFVEPPSGTRLGMAPFTIEMWLQPTAIRQSVLWSQGEDADSSIVIGTNSQNQVYLQYDDQSILSDVRMDSLDKWYHLAVTCSEEGVVSFYQTGELKTTGLLDSIPRIPGPMIIGSRAWTNANNYQGYMHEFRIWRTAQTNGQIQINLLKMLTGNELGLSILWPMDEGSGTEIRDIVRRKTATLYGEWAILPSGQALRFNGLDGNRLDIIPDDHLNFTRQHDFTVEFWMKASPGAGEMTMLSNGKGDGTDDLPSGWAYSVVTDGSLIIRHDGQMFTAIEKNVRDNDWHHIALVLNRTGNLNTYLDGLLQKSLYGLNFGEFAASKLYVGARGWPTPGSFDTDQYYTGDLDDIRIWNSARTKDQIQVDMRHRLLGNEPGLAFYLPFEAYTNVGGIELLTANIEDESQSMLPLNIFGSPDHIGQDPNIKLPRPVVDIDFLWSLNDDKIILTLNEDPVRIENVVLTIAAFGLQDLRGNEMAGPITWTAFVNQNQLQWQESDLFFEKPEKEPLYFDVQIENSGGIELTYEILNLPEWLTASPSEGSIGPVSEKTIQFTIDENVNIGDYTADINLLSGQGFNDKLIIDLHVFGVPPQWDIDPADYEYSMSIVADLEIFSELSDDPLDRVAAFINGEVRGLTELEYVEEFDTYLAYLDIYSDDESGDEITFKAWDASTGTTYPGVILNVGNNTQLSFDFEVDDLVGTPAQPAHFIVNGDLIQQVPINEGWTWISFNVLSTDFDDIDLFFSELQLEEGDRIVGYGNNRDADWNPNSGANGSFQGNLSSLDIEEMYKCNFSYSDILQVVGPRVDPDDYPIDIEGGDWTWIPFLSKERIELNEALADFDEVTDGDQIKSQTQFAVYDQIQQKWIGSLKAMEPGRGYMIHTEEDGDIIYPLRAVRPAAPPEEIVLLQNWDRIQWRRTEALPDRLRKHNMTMIATVSGVENPEDVRVTAMTNGRVLDMSSSEENGLHFLTLQSNGDQSFITFDIYDGNGEYLGTAKELVQWSNNDRLGMLDEPFVLHLESGEYAASNVFPNPFTDYMTIEVNVEVPGNVSMTLTDMKGRLVAQNEFNLTTPGIHNLVWDGFSDLRDDLSTGAYLLEVQTPGYTWQEVVIRQ